MLRTQAIGLGKIGLGKSRRFPLERSPPQLRPNGEVIGMRRVPAIGLGNASLYSLQRTSTQLRPRGEARRRGRVERQI